ncbi:hypothetical protein ACG74X_17990 [Marivita sp. S0852]|uniref:hypothetical protein n=1 Tax=Marivita sp. S0852 TaxID=3373893 RepID=UPI0039820D45
MFLELIAVIIAGLAGAGVTLMVMRLSGNRLPKWLIPVMAGAAMLGTTISSEYSWYTRTSDNLPDGLEVVQTVESTAIYRPWTYVFPYIDRFIAVDQPNVQANRENPDLLLADLYFFGRWSTVQSVEVMVNCATGQRADPALGDESPPVWRDVPQDDPIVTGVCQRS